MKLKNCTFNNFIKYSINKKVYAFGASNFLREFVKEDITGTLGNMIYKIVDNNDKKANTFMKFKDREVEIISLQQFFEDSSAGDVLLISTWYYKEIIEQLHENEQLNNIDCFNLVYIMDTFETVGDVSNVFKEWAENEKIPKVIHYCWFGNNDMPDKEKKCIESWAKYCPDYEIIRWDESNYDVTKNDYMFEAYNEKKWGFVPDFARLDIIYNYGGIYLDTDVELVQSINTLLNFKGFAGFESLKYVALGLGFGAVKNNELIKAFLDSYQDKHFINQTGEHNLIPSPVLQTEMLKIIGLKDNNSLQNLEGFVFLPKEFLCGYSVISGLTQITKNTHSIHHYSASWVPTSIKQSKQEYVEFWKKYNILIENIE